jgi:phage FluMu protein gp41
MAATLPRSAQDSLGPNPLRGCGWRIRPVSSRPQKTPKESARRAVKTVSDARAEALLKSALEKIVYFEARSGQLEGDAAAARAEVDRLKAELGRTSVQEVGLRQQLAELEVALGRAHRDREELGRVVDALRQERTALVEKLLDAARIRGVLSDEDGSFDLAAFISQLRSEVLAARTTPDGAPASPVEASAPEPESEDVLLDDAVAFQAEVARQMARGVWGESVEAPPEPPRAAEPAFTSLPRQAVERAALAPETQPRAVLQLEPELGGTGWAPSVGHQSPKAVSETTLLAESLHAQGRLGSPPLGKGAPKPRLPGSATLYGFSVRELSAPDAGARIRAAERLGALQDRAAASAVASALHAERDPRVAVALLEAFRRLSGREGADVVEPFLDAPVPEVRIAALRTLVALDAHRSVPQLQRASRDVEPSVRRRAALLGLQLPRAEALALERPADAESDPEVRRVAALTAGATGGAEARSALLAALDDPFPAVRTAAARSLSRLLDVEVDSVAALQGPQRRREIRRLTTLPVASLSARAKTALARTEPVAQRGLASTEVAVLDELPRLSPEALCQTVLGELQSAMRGRSAEELASLLGARAEDMDVACTLLTARGQVVRRGTKLFVA